MHRGEVFTGSSLHCPPLININICLKSLEVVSQMCVSSHAESFPLKAEMNLSRAFHVFCQILCMLPMSFLLLFSLVFK
jgi:hypothetical protein